MYRIRAIGSGTKYLCLCASSGLVAPSWLGDSRLRISVRASCACVCAMCDSCHGSDLSCPSAILYLVVVVSCYGSCTKGAGDHTCARWARVGAQPPALAPERMHARMNACRYPQGSFRMIRVEDTVSWCPWSRNPRLPGHGILDEILRFVNVMNLNFTAKFR